jgi:hypothetical protein
MEKKKKFQWLIELLRIAISILAGFGGSQVG